MTVLVEGNLQITIQNAISARKFDDPDSHRLSHCMKAVDFVVELNDSYLFIEIKDPQHPDAPIRETNRFARSFLSGELDDELRFKYRDSLLYEWAEERADKPVDYLVLIALDRLAPSDLLDRQDELQRMLPLQRPGSQPWPRPIVRSCGVFNIQTVAKRAGGRKCIKDHNIGKSPKHQGNQTDDRQNSITMVCCKTGLR